MNILHACVATENNVLRAYLFGIVDNSSTKRML